MKTVNQNGNRPRKKPELSLQEEHCKAALLRLLKRNRGRIPTIPELIAEMDFRFRKTHVYQLMRTLERKRHIKKVLEVA